MCCFLTKVCVSHGKHGKSWNLSIFRPGQSYNLSEGHGKSWKSNINVKLENKKAKRLKKIDNSLLISVEIDTSTHFMHYNAGKYVK